MTWRPLNEAERKEDEAWHERNREYLDTARTALKRWESGDDIAALLALMAFAQAEEERLNEKAWIMEHKQ